MNKTVTYFTFSGIISLALAFAGLAMAWGQNKEKIKILEVKTEKIQLEHGKLEDMVHLIKEGVVKITVEQKYMREDLKSILNKLETMR